MPPKKVEAPEKKPLIGRVGTNLRVGIVSICEDNFRIALN